MKLKNNNKVLSTILRILIACVFIASAILKYIDIEVFDIYIYEHNLFNFAVSSTLTRLLIAAEFVLGILLLTNTLIRFTYIVTYIFLIFFTIYLLLQPYLFDVQLDNCCCFGNAIVLNHTQSIIKNIVLMLLLWGVNIKFYKCRKYELPVFIVLSVVSVVAFMLLNSPDYLYKKIYRSDIRINEEVYQNSLKEIKKDSCFQIGNQLVCMYSHSCRYCKKSAVKINAIMKKNNIKHEQVKCIFWDSTDSTDILNFFSENEIEVLEYMQIPSLEFLQITHGIMPLILFSENGKIVKSVNYAELTEKDIVSFLKVE
ncbi:MAG TPA: DoxX family protein [Bacteroidales bacterium]|nr:DoxX family protein [Bacteroidales bacterium]